MRPKIVVALVIIAAIFISLFLHEIGHLLAFRYNGIEVEKVSVAAFWKLRMTVFTDSRGTEYEIGPIPLGGYTQPKEIDMNPSLAKEAEIDLAGIAANILIALFLTPWYFLLRKIWRKRGLDFVGSFAGKTFRVFITLNFLIAVLNALWLAPYVDGGRLVYFILSPRLGKTIAEYVGFGLGVVFILYLWNGGTARISGLINKLYGWTGWPGPREDS